MDVAFVSLCREGSRELSEVSVVCQVLLNGAQMSCEHDLLGNPWIGRGH